MQHKLTPICSVMALAWLIGAPVKAQDIKWAKIELSTTRDESCVVCDVNNDGKLDIIAGTYWYEAPQWTQHFLRAVPKSGEYVNSAGEMVLDVNQDGYLDVIACGWFTEDIIWAENPKGKPEPWPVHLIMKRKGFTETLIPAQVDGKGPVDVLINYNEPPVRWIEVIPGPEPKFIEHTVGREGGVHGIGFGDVDNDGKGDIVTPAGWWRAIDPATDKWEWHTFTGTALRFDASKPIDPAAVQSEQRPAINLGHAGVPILVHDVNGDGRNDILWGLGHEYGLFWMEQQAGEGGAMTWAVHLIDGSFSQVHTLTLADLNNDGRLDLLSGKRWRAHNDGDPGAFDPMCIYCYTFDPPTGKWTRYRVDYGGLAGVGMQLPVVDIDGDGDLDIVSPGKAGLHLLINQGPKPPPKPKG